MGDRVDCTRGARLLASRLCFFFASRRRHTRCALVTGVQTCALPICIITNDNIGVLVPNAEFVNGRVVNWTHRSVNRRIRVPFRVGFGVDKELVKQAALEAAARVPFTLATEGEQRPQVWLVAYGENGVDFLLVVWLTGAASRRNVAIQAAYLWELDTSLREHGIEIARPQRDLRLRSATSPH